jgi:maltooligosyltrehalose trehalohydrolase
VPAERFVVFAQNHDQVGNRRLGERLSQLVDFDALKVAAGALLFSPFLPLLFMGEEYGESAPFQYFISHTDPQLVEAVRKGRSEEFARFAWQGNIPDPQDEAAFLRSKLNWNLRGEDRSRILLEFYTALLRLRRELPALARLDKRALAAVDLAKNKALALHRWHEAGAVFAIFNFAKTPENVIAPIPSGNWQKLLDSAEARWLGNGKVMPETVAEGTLTLRADARTFALYSKRH